MPPISSTVSAARDWLQHRLRPGFLRAVIDDRIARLRLKRWVAAKARARPFLQRRITGGSRMRFYLDSRVCRPMYVGTFERDEQRFIARFLRPGDCFYDVGAHYGLFTLIASRKVGRTGRVLAIEPTPQTRERLQANIGLNAAANVDVLPVAVSDIEGEAELCVSDSQEEAWNTLALNAVASGFHRIGVAATTLDALAAERGDTQRITLIKIDVEGWERRVLRGARDLLKGRNAPVLLMEFSDTMSNRDGSTCRDLYRDLIDLGYEMYVYDAENNRLVPETCRDEYVYSNLVACKSREAVQARLASAGSVTTHSSPPHP
jgi:FkbM family methyltransferase